MAIEDINNTSAETTEAIDKIGNQAKNAVSGVAKKGIRKATNGIKNAAKNMIKKVAQAALKAVIHLITAFFPVFLVAIGIIIVVVIFANLDFLSNYNDKADNQDYSNEKVAITNAQMSNVLSAVFYNKYSDQSFYFTLSEPNETAMDTELNSYSGKTYEELKGEKNRGLTQAGYDNYINDIDGYEENVKLSTGILSSLDKYLNDAGNTGYYYPEQFIKALYVGDSCDLSDEDLDVKTCQLGNLYEAESVKYEKMNKEDDYYTENDAVTEEGTHDYGLGALVHYQAYYQPSRIFNYKIETVNYIDQDWEYGDSNSPLKTGIAWSSLDKNTRDEILAEYKYQQNNFSSSTGKGLLQTGETGIYDVDNEIVYKDWAAAYYADEPSRIAKDANTMYTNLEWEKWASSDPMVSTGVLDTSVVYAIDNALTYFGNNNIAVTQKWTNIGEATHEQTGTYLKDYTSGEATVQNAWTIKAPSNSSETLKRLYIDGDLKGYMISTPFWQSGTYEKSTRTEYYEEQVSNTADYCGGKTGIAYYTCLNGTHGETRSRTIHTMSLDGGTWEFHLVRDVNGNPVDETITVQVDGVGEEDCSDSSCSSFKNKYSTDHNKEDCKWRYEPSFIFKIGAVTKGDLQVNLVSHSNNSIETENGVTNYLEDYFKTYQTYIPNSYEQFGCYSSTSTMPNDALPSASLNSQTYNYGSCKENEFTLAMASSGYMKTLGVDGMSEIQKEALKYAFGITDENYGDSENVVAFRPESLTVPINMSDEISTKLANIGNKYSKQIEKYAGTYGVDKNILISLIYIAEVNGDTNLTGVHCDNKVVCTLKDVKDFSDAKSINADKTKKVDLIIGNNLTDDEAIKFAAAKMQLLLEKYDGNILLSIMEYNAGSEATDRLLKIYEAQEGYPVEATIENKYETGWYHFVDEVIGNAANYGINVNEGANTSALSMFLSSISSNALFWTRMDDNGTLSTVIWNKLFIKDSLSISVSKKIDDPYVIKALYSLKKNEGENYKKYWASMTSGQKSWSSSSYINSEGKYEVFRPYTAILIKPNLTAASIENGVKSTLAFDSDVRFEDMDITSKNYWVSKLGNIVVEPSYKSVVGDINNTIAKKFETIQSVGYDNTIVGASAYSNSWVVDIEEDLEVNSITKGIIHSLGTETVVVETEQGALVTYEGIKDIKVKVDDDADGAVLGNSKGVVKVSVLYDDQFYDMEKFVNKYIEESQASSMMFFNSLSSFLGCSKLLPEETERLWAIIHETISNGGMTGAFEYQCTMFTNYMATIKWGDAIRAKFGHIPNVNGNGNTKVDRLKEHLGDVLGSVQWSLPDDGENIAFSWDGGKYGHTGWIDECKYDPSMEGNGYVIVSQGNVDYNGGISWQHRYTWDEWTSAYPQGTGAIKYVWLA